LGGLSWIGLCWALVVLAQATTSAETNTVAAKVPADKIALSADFEGALDPSVSSAYFCKGVARFIFVPTAGNPSNRALLLTLDPTKATAVGRCDPANAPAERTELAEPDEARLPLGTEVWYSFRFMIPGMMKGKFVGDRAVIAQLKQSPNTCPLGPQPFGLAAAAEGNPTISLRVIEDRAGDSMGLQLAVSGDGAPKLSVGRIMRQRDLFLDHWHDVVLHAMIAPSAGKTPSDPSFVEGWLDGQPFARGLYGVLDGKGTADKREPFGYAGLVGCTYFKYGIYRDRQAERWIIGFDRFRRGATRESVETPLP
jgi:hypothetical protein